MIEAVGDRAAERWGVTAGDRVAVEVFLVVPLVRAVPARRPPPLPAPRPGGHVRDAAASRRSPGLWGGYATHQYLAPDSMLLPVPDSLSPEVAVAFNPLGAGIRWGVTLPGTKPGDVVAVLGCGIRGLSAAAAAKEAGAAFVMVTGAGERDHPRLAEAGRFGADLAVDVRAEDPVSTAAGGGRRRRRRRRRGRHRQGAGCVRAGRRTGAGRRHDGRRRHEGRRAGTPGFDPDHVVYKELRVQGALGVDTADYRAALDLLARGTYPFADLPRRTVGLDDAAALLETMAGERGVPPVHAVLVPSGMDPPG